MLLLSSFILKHNKHQNSNLTTRQEGTITPVSNISLYNDADYHSKLYRVSNVVTLTVAFETTSAFSGANNWRTVMTLPVGFRPVEYPMPISVSLYGSGHTVGSVYDGRISTDGQVQVFLYSQNFSFPRAIINATYLV